MWDTLTATVAVSMPWITSRGDAEAGRLHEDLGQRRDDLLKNHHLSGNFMDANAPVWAAWGVAEFRAVKCLFPRRPKTVARPWLAERIAQDGCLPLFRVAARRTRGLWASRALRVTEFQ